MDAARRPVFTDHREDQPPAMPERDGYIPRWPHALATKCRGAERPITPARTTYRIAVRAVASMI
jgi:hypothetical protein